MTNRVKFARTLSGSIQPVNLGMITYAARGDHAGSDASVGVLTTRSLKPVMSTETRRDENPDPRLSCAEV